MSAMKITANANIVGDDGGFGRRRRYLEKVTDKHHGANPNDVMTSK